MGKSMRLILVVAAVLFFIPAFVMPRGLPSKNADEVSDVNDPYTASDWVISPDDELATEVKVDNAPEVDIKGAISCFDKDYLRVDILLDNSITYDVKVWYAVKFEYSDMVEYYTYYPVSKDFIYEKEVNGEVTETVDLTTNNEDFCGVTSSGKKADSDVYLIINKDKHIAGDVGNKYYLTTSFYSGYVDTKGKMKIADTTKKVNLYFTR